jgi:ATP-dependent Clp protease ATP-binding subunit ClpB
VRGRPYSIVLLDEIEKAHPDVFNVLLQLLDDGRLTDGQGRTVDFRNTVLIMTSNLGSQIIQDMGSRAFEDVRERVMEELQGHFRPEFINRVDEIIVFRQLTREQLAQIVEIQLAELQKRLSERKIELRVTQAAKELLAERGWDPVYGARPLKRTIQRLVADPLALLILEGRFRDGDVIMVDVENGELQFSKVAVEEPAARAGS